MSSMKEKDDFSALFKGIADARMQVKDGFWESLEKDLASVAPVAETATPVQAKVMPMYHKWVAAASVLLVLAVGSVAFWYLNSQESDIQQAFNEMAANVEASQSSTSTPIINNELAQLPVESERPADYFQPSAVNGQRSTVIVEQSSVVEDDDDEMVPFEITWQIVEQGYVQGGNPYNGLMKASDGNLVSDAEAAASIASVDEKESRWALKPAVGTSLPKGDFKMPLTAGLMLERKLNKRLAVEAGLLYNYLPADVAESQSSLSLPVKLDVNVVDSKKLDLYATIGGVAEKLLGKSFSEEPVQLAATAGLGVRYKLNDKLALYAEPSVSHYFDTDGNTSTLRTEQAVNLSLLCGVRMSY